MRTPNRVRSLQLEATCVGITAREWDKLMEGATRADRDKVNKLVKEHLPDLAKSLSMDHLPLKKLRWYNPYNYYKTRKHLVLVHSSIEYFIRYN